MSESNAIAVETNDATHTELTLDQRAAKVVAEMNAGEPGTEAAVGESTQPLPNVPKEALDARAQRQARIDKIRADEQAKEQKRQMWREQRQKDASLEQLRAERDSLALRAAEADSFKKALSSEEGFFELAQKANVSPDKLAAYIRSTLSDPSVLAAKQARDAISPEVAALRKELEGLKAELGQTRSSLAQRDSNAAEYQARDIVVSHAKVCGESAPLTNRYFEAMGADAFIALAENVGRHLPENAGREALFDAIENELDTLSAVYRPLSQQQSKAPPSKQAAAKAPVTGLSNRVASARATVVDEVDPSDLDLDQRASRLKLLLGGLG